jgi:DNA (cytosine-5)-methyltransferase 1
MSNEKPTHLDLFSGIGGFSLAFEAEGFQTIGFSEIDPYASAVLKKHWPEVRNYGDVRNVPRVRCAVLTGGFPCQPFSLAGKRRGKADDRFLWPAMLDVIKRCRPAFVLGENVPGIIGMELDRVLFDMEANSYTCQTLSVPACAVDAKHRRNRVWIVAHTSGRGERQLSIRARGQDEADSDVDGRSEALADTDGAGLQVAARGQLKSIPSAAEPSPRGAANGGIAEAWASWPTEPELGRVAHGIPNRTHRLKCLGNAIVPQVAQVFARAIYQELMR